MSEVPMLAERIARIGMIARWKPVHLGHAAVLEALCERAEHALVGIGSSNVHDLRNPFTASETADMIRAALHRVPQSRYTLIEVPDLGHGPRWRAMVCELFGALELFVTANEHVRSLLEHDYRIVHPIALLSPERRVRLDGTMVRVEMARGEGWRTMVPGRVAALLDARELVTRFREEFGPATLALDARRAGPAGSAPSTGI